jgi:hypothetical protein
MGRGGDNVVATLTQNGDNLRADATRATNDDDLHVLSSLVEFAERDSWAAAQV